MNNDAMIDSLEIKKILRHRFPFTLVDRILHIDQMETIIGLKNVTVNEPFFQGHFLETDTMPGSMILESMAQTGYVLILKDPEYSARLASFSSINTVSFFDPVRSGDQLRLEVSVKKIKENYIEMIGRALVEGKVVCEGDFSFVLSEVPTKAQIHPTASVHRTAILGKNVVIGPNTIVGEHVIIGDSTRIEGHCFIEKWTQIGNECRFHFGSVIGSAPQDLKYKGEKSWVVIGHRNEIREYVTINRPTGANTVTKIGDDNTFLTSVHIAHNCTLANNIIIANMTNIAGHTTIESNVTIGGMTGIHQFSRIGQGAMIGAYTRLSQDVPPFLMCEGNPALIRGLNLIGLRRNNASKEELSELKMLYKLLYRSSKNTTQAIQEMKETNITTPRGTLFLDFIQSESIRGFTKKKDMQGSASSSE
jgi:UDP-N-acetylglucosamine acyltransferase